MNLVIPSQPFRTEDKIAGAAPQIWFGADVVNGAISPWKDAPLGSLYIRNTTGNVVLSQKRVFSNQTTDWKNATWS